MPVLPTLRSAHVQSPAPAAPALPQRAAGLLRRWPVPALLTWLGAWALLLALAGHGPLPAWSAAVGLGLAVAAALRGASRWRRRMLAAGFPVSALLQGLAGGLPAALLPTAAPEGSALTALMAFTAWSRGAGAWPAWLWLLPVGLLLAVYPLRAWRDAPLFPTPARALDGLAALAPLPAGAQLLDAGCGLGHGLDALRDAYPQAGRIAGIEWSWPLRLACALRCPWASVRRADMWAADWSGCALVYLFQRPESMARALAKAEAEMASGAWLASLEFAVPGVTASAVLRRAGAKPVWLYRLGQGAAAALPATAAQSAGLPADKPDNNPSTPPARPGGR